MSYTLLVPPSLGTARAAARAELVATSLAGELGIDVKVRVAADYAEVRRDTLSAAVELSWAPSAVIAELEEARAVLRAVRSGNGFYHSAIITRADNGLTLHSLQKKRAVWVDPLSLGGYLLPMAWLRGQGIEPNLAFDTQEFLGSHRDVVDAVLEGRADIAAVSTPTREPQAVKQSLELYARGASDRLQVLGVTDPAPTDALVVTIRVESNAADRLVKKLLPPLGRGRTPSSLLTAMEAEKLERGTLDEYKALRSLWWTKRATSSPPRK